MFINNNKHPIKIQNLKDGRKAELKIHDTLTKHFGEIKNNNDNDIYSHIDFKNENYAVEYKRRFINYGQYDTLFFEYVKVKEALLLMKQNPKLRVFFIWECNNGVYYWEYNEDEFFMRMNGRTDRGKDERRQLVNIKLEYIFNIEKLIL
tara:strand:- start:201 stop:647 length:447 start_codon:yes stop_codon:yes gene_type:complete